MKLLKCQHTTVLSQCRLTQKPCFHRFLITYTRSFILSCIMYRASYTSYLSINPIHYRLNSRLASSVKCIVYHVSCIIMYRVSCIVIVLVFIVQSDGSVVLLKRTVIFPRALQNISHSFFYKRFHCFFDWGSLIAQTSWRKSQNLLECCFNNTSMKKQHSLSNLTPSFL